MEQNTILLARTDKGWAAIYRGPHRAEIERLFGCNVLPTAFTSEAASETVVAFLKAKNPNCSVVVGP